MLLQMNLLLNCLANFVWVNKKKLGHKNASHLKRGWDKKIPTSLFIINHNLTRYLIELFVRLLDSKKLLIILAGLGLRNQDFVYRFLSHRLFFHLLSYILP